MTESASFIIPSFNSAKTIRHTLDSILTQKQNEFHLEEIIVVDSSSDGITKGILTEYSSNEKNVVVIRKEKKIAPAVARNLGARQAKGSILIFIDSDIILEEQWLSQMSNAFIDGCKIAGSGISVASFQKNIKSAVAQYYLQLNEFIPVGQKREKQFLPSCNLLCSREIFDEVGGFPETRASEDVLFGLKAGERNKIWFLPEIQVEHIFRQGITALIKNQMLLGEYNLIYRRKLSEKIYYKGIMPLILLPLFFSIKILRMNKRILLSGRDNINNYVKILPFFILGLIFWYLGALRGCMRNLDDLDALRERLAKS